VFDNPVNRDCAEAFLVDPHLHIAVAIEDEHIIGFASAVDYIHPDKPREMWINEVAVAPDRRNAGVGTAVLGVMLGRAHAIGCLEAWVLTDAENRAAVTLYESAGGLEEWPGQRMYVFAMSREAAQWERMMRDASGISDGDRCEVVAGTHAGKRGTVEDKNLSKSGHLTITVRQDNDVRFKTLAKNVLRIG
jgi:GNAT superfamily N-acetyltransferase